jgi:hypothetical protein
MFPTKFRFIWPTCFREEFKKSANQKKESPVAAMIVNRSGRNKYSLQKTFHRCFLPSFGSFGKVVLEEKIFKNLYKRYVHFEYRYLYLNKNCLLQPCLVMDQNEISNLYRGPSIDASYQVSYYLAKRFQRKCCFRNRTIRNKNCLRRPCLLTEWAIPIDASC